LLIARRNDVIHIHAPACGQARWRAEPQKIGEPTTISAIVSSEFDEL